MLTFRSAGRQPLVVEHRRTHGPVRIERKIRHFADARPTHRRIEPLGADETARAIVVDAATPEPIAEIAKRWRAMR